MSEENIANVNEQEEEPLSEDTNTPDAEPSAEEEEGEGIDEEVTEATESPSTAAQTKAEDEEGKASESHVMFSDMPEQLEGGEEDEDEGEAEGEGEETPASEVPQNLAADDLSDDELFDEVESLIEVKERDVTKHEVLEKKKQRVLGSIISIRRGDQTYFDRQKVPKFQNSYKLDSDKPFNAEKVTNILKDVLEEALVDLVYDPDVVPKKAKWASSAIRARVKEQEYDRYKIICYVTIGEKLCQDIFTILRFLWDAERDAYAVHVHENLHLFAIGLCFGIYYE